MNYKLPLDASWVFMETKQDLSPFQNLLEPKHPWYCKGVDFRPNQLQYRIQPRGWNILRYHCFVQSIDPLFTIYTLIYWSRYWYSTWRLLFRSTDGLKLLSHLDLIVKTVHIYSPRMIVLTWLKFSYVLGWIQNVLLSLAFIEKRRNYWMFGVPRQDR